MTATLSQLNSEVRDFVTISQAEAERAFDILYRTGSLNAAGTLGFVQRIPDADILVSFHFPDPWKPNEPVVPSFLPLDAEPGPGRFNKIFQKYPEITTISHVHPPHLCAWAQTQRPFPILYAPLARNTFVRELPAYIDRRQDQADFILDRLSENAYVPGILECNGGATVWGRDGILKLAQFILVLEEAATIQFRAASIGGSKDFGPGVLDQQYEISGKGVQAQEAGIL